RLRFSGPKTSIICSPMTSLKTSIKTITYLSDIGCLEIQGASLVHGYMNRQVCNAFLFRSGLPDIDSCLKSQVALSLKWTYTIRNRDFIATA
ncbi:hypothetical protein ACBQ30_23445, partial [Escherichia coli]